MGAICLLWGCLTVRETDHVGACVTKATGEGYAQSSAGACDADGSAMEGGLGHGASLGHP